MRRRASPLVPLALFAAVALAACTAADADAPAGSSPGAASQSATPAASASAPAGLPVDPESGLPTAFDDAGVGELDAEDLVAGIDIAPGTYRTAALEIEDDGNQGILFDHSCKWRLREGGTSGFEGIVSVGNNDRGRPTFTIEEGQSVVSLRCGRWDRVDEETMFAAPEAAATEIGDGIWLVGEDMAPGVWRANDAGDPDDPDLWCSWEIDSDWRDWLAEMIDFGVARDGRPELALETGQQFRGEGCDGWVRVSAPEASPEA
ncbi:hypothetical protein [Demequina mangrovi]|uniref:Lipoprotein n=1 Tax=Demequina mangrovi TaxID=1043493 RepID=A0A1H7AJE7_9MICO|nr:hypothetical protein [Demequina mangrovi]SEJ64017.1 hypothetical protein SAMN05421637_2524 [Demequina mangrovi]